MIKQFFVVVGAAFVVLVLALGVGSAMAAPPESTWEMNDTLAIPISCDTAEDREYLFREGVTAENEEYFKGKCWEWEPYNIVALLERVIVIPRGAAGAGSPATGIWKAQTLHGEIVYVAVYTFEGPHKKVSA